MNKPLKLVSGNTFGPNIDRIYSADMEVDEWMGRIVVYGHSEADAEGLRDRVLKSLCRPVAYASEVDMQRLEVCMPTEIKLMGLSREPVLAADASIALEADDGRNALCSVTVGHGLMVSGPIEAIHRVQSYIMLDSRHPIEAEDTRRSLARSLQAAESTLDFIRPALPVLRDMFRAAGLTAGMAKAEEMIAAMDETAAPAPVEPRETADQIGERVGQRLATERRAILSHVVTEAGMQAVLAEWKHLSDNCPELNMANYSHDDVETLNNWAVEVALLADKLPGGES